MELTVGTLRAIAASERAAREAQMQRAGFRDFFMNDEEKVRARQNRELVGSYQDKPCLVCGQFHYQERE